jgi:hypothetical protein
MSLWHCIRLNNLPNLLENIQIPHKHVFLQLQHKLESSEQVTLEELNEVTVTNLSSQKYIKARQEEWNMGVFVLNLIYRTKDTITIPNLVVLLEKLVSINDEWWLDYCIRAALEKYKDSQNRNDFMKNIASCGNETLKIKCAQLSASMVDSQQ